MKRLALRWPLGRTWLLAVLLLAALFTLLELFARTPLAASIFPIASYGSSHPHFDTQVQRILDRTRKDGALDCIFLGDSQVIHGIDPDIIEPALSKRLGRPVRCQNFGLGGGTSLSAESLGKFLIQRFHPSLIVFGTSSLNYVASAVDYSHTSIVASPWLAYELGKPSVDGWLLENSYAFRYYNGTLKWFFGGGELNSEIQPSGHSNKFDDRTNMTVQEQLEYFGDIASGADLSPRHIQGLRRFLALTSAETRIIVVEMPIDPQYFELNAALRRTYPEFLAMLQQETTAAGVPLYLTQESLAVPEDGWHDLIHLNRKGTDFFSAYLVDILASNLPASPPAAP